MAVIGSMISDKSRTIFGYADGSLDRVMLIEGAERQETAGYMPVNPLRLTDRLTEAGDYIHENKLLRLEISFLENRMKAEPRQPLPEEWIRLLEELRGLNDVRQLRIYENAKAPAAAAWHADGSVTLHGDDTVFGKIQWQRIAHMVWEQEGFAGIDDAGTAHGTGSLLPLENTKASRLLCMEGNGAFTAVGGLQRPDGSIFMLNRFRKRLEPLGERVDKIQILQVPTTGRCVWVGLACHTHRFLTSESGDTLSADHFGGPYTEEISPNRYHQKIKDFIAVPRRWLAVLYQNGFLRIFGRGYAQGEILCEGVAAIEREGEALLALIPRDLSQAPMLEEPLEELQEDSPALALGEAADPAEFGKPIEGRLRAALEAPVRAPVPLRIRAAQRTADMLYLIHEDNRVTAQPMRGGAPVTLPWGGDALPPIVQIYPSLHGCFVLCRDNTLYGYSPDGEMFVRWENTREFTHNWSLAAALTREGCVLVYPFPKNNEGRIKEHFCNGHVTLLEESEEWDFTEAEEWRDLRGIAVGEDVLYGLTAGGKVLSAGSGENGQRRVADWRDIRQIACLDHVVFGLRQDGTVVSAGQSFFANYAVGDWKNIIRLRSFQNSMASLLIGLNRQGALTVAGRWSMDTYAYDNHFPTAYWQNINDLRGDGYYLTARTADGKMLYQSTPAPDGGAEPAEEHTFHWQDVSTLQCREGRMLLLHRNGTVSWEGKKRPAPQKVLTDGWQRVTECFLWRAAPQRYFVVGITSGATLLCDAAADADPAVAAQFAACQRELTGVKQLGELEQYLVILHRGGLTLLGWEKETLCRHDFAGVSRYAITDNGRSLCMEHPDSSLLCIGQTVYDSRAEGEVMEVHRLLKNGQTAGVIGLRQGGVPFLLTEQNDPRSDPRWYALPELLQLLSLRNAVQITTAGTVLLRDGRCIARGVNPLHRWSGIRQLSDCTTHTVGLTSFGTMLLHSPGGEGGSLEEYTGIRQVLCLPYTTLFLRQDGRLFMLCTRYAQMPCQPLPVSRDITAIAGTSSHLAILTQDGDLWCAGAIPQAADRWGKWERHSRGVSAIRVQNDRLLLWRQDSARLLLAPTITSEQFSGMEPTIPED